MDDDITFYTISPQKLEYEYNVDAWAENISNWIFKGYKPATTYIVMPLTDREIVAIIRNIYKLLNKLEKKINKILTKPMFFRLSTLSPKDAYIKLQPELEILLEDTQDKIEDKIKMQLKLLRVSNFKNIINLIQNSNRAIEDLKLYLAEENITNANMSIILQEWRPSTGNEYRLFIKNSILVAMCPFDNTDILLNKLLVNEFICSLSNQIKLKNYVVDVFLGNDNKIYFIEINPYSINTDSLIFSWFDKPLGPLL